MQKDFYLSYASMVFGEDTGLGRKECEQMLNAHYQGLKGASVDYVFQPATNGGWLLSGLSPFGARAVVSLCKGLRIAPTRLDVTMAIREQEFRGKVTDWGAYLTTLARVKNWFAKHRPTVAIEENAQMPQMARTTFGSRTSRWALSITDATLTYEPGLGVTFQLRQDRVKAGWEWLAGLPTSKDSEFEFACSELFAACTNTLLSQDFFGVGNSAMPFLASERKTVEKRDWYATLSAFANKIIQTATESEDPISIEASIAFLEKETANRLLSRSKSATM